MEVPEIALTGGRSAGTIVRIGNMVHRSPGPNPAFTKSVLEYMEQVKFPFTPRYRGIDDQGRIKLTFLPGQTPLGLVFSSEQLMACAKLLRAFHDHTALSDLCGASETICHHDFAPWNILFDAGKPVGIIDFDEVQPGARIIDFAYFLWTFLELGTLQATAAQQIEKISLLCQTYELENTEQLVPALLSEQERILDFRKEKAQNDPDPEERAFSMEATRRIQKEIAWIKNHSLAIENALKSL